MILYAATNIIICYVEHLCADEMKLNFNGYYSNLSSIQSVFFREDTLFIHIYFSHIDIRYHLKFLNPLLYLWEAVAGMKLFWWDCCCSEIQMLPHRLSTKLYVTPSQLEVINSTVLKIL